MTEGRPTPEPAAVARARRAARRLLCPALLAFTVASHWPRLSFAGPDTPPGLVLDKLVHVTGFAVLAALLVFAAWPRGWNPRTVGLSGRLRRRSAAAGLIVAAWGFVDESTQLLVGRQMTAGDLAADALGAAVGAAWAWWAGRRLFAWAPAEPAVAGDRTAAAAADGTRGGELVRSASVVSVLTTVSRVTGLARDAVLAGLFGAGQLLDAFFVAFLVPNLFRRLFGEGALTAAFLPRYRRLLDDDPEAAGRYAAAVLREAAAWLVGAVLLAEAVLLGLLVAGVGGDKARLGFVLTATMLPYAPLVCGTALLGAIGQARDRFGPAAAAPVILNLGMIVAAAVAALATPEGPARVLVVAASVVALGVLQLLAVRAGIGPVRAGVRVVSPLAEWTARDLPLAATRRAMLPMILGLGVFQVNTLLDGLLAFSLSAPAAVAPGESGQAAVLHLFGRELAYPIRTGGVSTLTLAQRLYQFPLGVFGIAIATAIFPRLSAAAGDPAAFARTLRRGLWLSLAIGLPASAGLLATRVPLARVVFERGAFDAGDAAAVARVLAGYAVAVWAYMLMHLWTRAFYAKDDATTPLKVAVAAVFLNLALNLTLVWPLGAAGMAWATAVSAVVQTIALAWILRRRGWLRGSAAGAGLPGRLPLAVVGGTVSMALVLAAVNAVSPAATLAGTGVVAQLVLLVIVGAAVYATVLLLVVRKSG